MVGVLQGVEHAGANRLRDVQPAVHCAGSIGPAHGDHAASAFVLHANAVALRRALLAHIEHDARRVGIFAHRHAACCGLTEDFFHGKCARPARGGVVREVEARGHRANRYRDNQGRHAGDAGSPKSCHCSSHFHKEMFLAGSRSVFGRPIWQCAA